MNKQETFLSFWEHLAELRQAFMQCLGIILVSTALCFWFHQELITFLTYPLKETSVVTPFLHQEFKRERISNTGANISIYESKAHVIQVVQSSSGVRELSPGHYSIPPKGYLDVEILVSKSLVFFTPLDGLSATIKICFWLGLIVSSPLWIYPLLRFVIPALDPAIWKWIFPFISFSFFFLFLGISFAYVITVPFAVHYLEQFNASLGLNLWSFSQAVEFIIFLMLANGFVFELALILFFLVHYAFLNAEQLASKRRHVIVLAFILGALLTPPDIITQFLLAIPLIGLYELAIVYASIIAKQSIDKSGVMVHSDLKL